MRIRKFAISSVLTIATSLAAQTTPAQTVCLARIEGLESHNWNLRPSLVRELTREFKEQRSEVNVVPLEAENAKQTATQASEKHCDYVVYSDLEREAGEVNSQMNPDITKRGTAIADGTGGTSVLHFNFTVKNANRKKIGDGKVKTKILGSFSPTELEQSGRTMVSDIVDKIVAVVLKQ